MTKTRDLSDFLIEGGADLPLGKPHIVPGVLYPAVAGKLLDGTTSHSGNYGTPQTQSGGDGRSYYYTDIKGSKPIKDPRIGGHFGSQRHKFKSLQLLEQETATHDNDVFSIDGREWVRGVGGTNASITPNDDSGNRIRVYGFVEIVGYFIDVNLIIGTHSNDREFNTSVDGGSASSANTLFQTSVVSPLGGRYVDVGSVGNLGLGLSLGIHTLKVTPQAQSENIEFFGIELIAQDTTSTANRSKIQIPSQDVVSFGKKFNVSGTPHYDPFTTMSYGGSGTTLSALQSLIDTDTSLGMDAWKAGTSNYHRPWNGGRIIKWVDSSGTIKTSVNMMPPNAQNIGTTASNAVSDAHVIAGTNDDTINFNTSPIDQTQAEVAKTFHFREFGNGNANGGATGTFKDASMLDTGSNRDIAYVMDDGLTSICADDVRTDSTRGTIRTDGVNDNYYITFIGTGFSFTNQTNGTTFGSGDDFDFIVDGVVVKSWQAGSTINEKTTVVQNLPYGTHVFKMLNTAAPAVQHMHAKEFTFHQPKRPPIPEDACVLADYMLMADFVKQATGTQDTLGKVSKGVRMLSGSRDLVCDDTGSRAFYNDTYDSVDLDSTNFIPQGLSPFHSHASTNTSFAQVPFFGTNALVRVQQHNLGHVVSFNGGSAVSFTGIDNSNGSDHKDLLAIDSNVTLANNTIKTLVGAGGAAFIGYDLVTPIHTSSHYQSFETPYLHELVGGDRNMEQHNLVCSPDGKTWDEITRDTSYIGNAVLKTSHANTHDNIVNIFDDWRGGTAGVYNGEYFNKDFAIGYDRMICLKEGNYLITFLIRSNKNDDIAGIKANGQLIKMHKSTVGEVSQQTTVTINLKRGDYIQGVGVSGGGTGAYEILANFQIIRL